MAQVAGLKVTVDKTKKILIIEIPMQTPTASKSGKNLTIATTHGNTVSDCKINGGLVTIGVNAYIPNPDYKP